MNEIYWTKEKWSLINLLNRITGPDKADNDLLNRVLSHEYAKKLLEPPTEEELQ